MRWLVLTVLVATPALAGGPRFRVGARFGPAWVKVGTSWGAPRPAPQVVVVPTYLPLAWWSWFPVQQVQPAPVAAPLEVIIEREVVREVAAPAPPPQVIVIEQPAPPPPLPVALAPAPLPEPVKPPPGPRVPGPDVFTWTDADGVVYFSTRVPAAARARAKKVGSGAQ